MKKINILSLLLFTVGLIWFSACEERIDTDYTPYKPDKNISIVYQDTSFYPTLANLVSGVPEINVASVYTLKIDSVSAQNGEDVSVGKFTIDNETGVITYNNSDGSINPGNYIAHVILATPNSYYRSEYKFTVEKIPITLTASPQKPSTGALAIEDISTVSYIDESPDQRITEVSYSLSPTVTGFTIDESSGVLSKNTQAPADTTIALGIKATTNLGTRTFDSVVVVTVGAPPTIEYKQSNDLDKLNKVTLSPWTAYSTGQPDLQGMDANNGWEILVANANSNGATIDPAWFTIATNGVISIAADQNLPLGDIVLGVRPTNGSGVSFDFDSLFTIHVEKRWDATPVFFEDFNNATGTEQLPEDYNSALKGYVIAAGTFKVKHWSLGNGSEFYAPRLFKGGSASPDAVMTLKLSVGSAWRGLKVSFKELYGYGAASLAQIERILSYAYDNSDLENGNFNQANWTTIMDAAHSDWVTTNLWGSNKTDNDFIQVPPQELLGFDHTQSNVFLNWHYYAIATGKGGQFFVDNIKVEVSEAFAAEEQ